MTRKVDKLVTVRFGSARYSVPARLVGASVLVSAVDEQVVIRHAGDEVARHPLAPPGGVAPRSRTATAPGTSDAPKGTSSRDRSAPALGKEQLTLSEKAELARLRRENTQLRMEKEILKQV